MRENVDLMVHGAEQLLTLVPELNAAPESDPEARDLGAIPDGAAAIRDGVVVDVGSSEKIRETFVAERTIDASGRLVTPGLVDSHTHAVFAGSRHREFGMRMRGDSYLDILEAGGGIHATVEATRRASREQLVAEALPRLETALRHGVTAMEIKSGYGLDYDTEIKMLEAVRELDGRQPIRLLPTYLGAHVVPREHSDDREGYLKLMIEKAIPEVARRGLATACDVFLDRGAFTAEEAREVLSAARDAGLEPKIHAGQFTDLGGPQMIAELTGLSADHLERISDEGIAAMAAAGVVANLLPGAAFSLRDEFPDGRRLIDGGVEVALSTDDNPGSSRTENLTLMAAMGATRMGLSCSEAWRGITVSAARALGISEESGSLAPGRSADLAVFAVPDFRSVLYHFGINHVETVIAGGRVVAEGAR